MEQNIMNLVFMLVGLVLVPAIPIVAKYAVDAFKAWSVEKLANADNALVSKYLTEITDMICQVVMCTSQTYVDALKAEGKFDAEAQKVAFNTTKDNVIKLLTQEAKEFLAEAYGDIDLWLDTKIEQIVLTTK